MLICITSCVETVEVLIILNWIELDKKVIFSKIWDFGTKWLSLLVVRSEILIVNIEIGKAILVLNIELEKWVFSNTC